MLNQSPRSSGSLTRVLKFLPKASDYRPKYFRVDVLAGVTVAFVALPLALGFGVTAGAGATAGIVTAIVAGVVAAVFGGSNFQVTGPTGAMTAVLLPIVAHHGPGALPILGIGAGLILIALGLAGIGRYVRFIPWPVVTGFTNGIAVIIFLQQLPNVLGVKAPLGESIVFIAIQTVREYVAQPSYLPAVIALITVAAMLGWGRVKLLSVVPASMAALVIVTLISLLPPFADLARIGEIPRSLPLPMLPDLALSGAWVDLSRGAIAIAILAALESLLCAVVADGMTVGEKHDPDRELFGQGLGNIAAGLFGGLPSTAALARTAVNVRSGARTRLASIVHGLTLLVVILFLAPLASKIPLAVLGGILMVVAVRMVEREAASLIMRSTKSDAFVLLLTMVVTIFFDLILAIEVGLVAAAILFIVRMSNMFTVDPIGLAGDVPHHDDDETVDAERQLLAKHVVAYRVDGPVFFGAAERFIDQLVKVDQGIKVVVLRLKRVPVMDATGVTALRAIHDRLSRRGIALLISGLQPQPKALLQRMGVYEEITRDGTSDFVTTEQALEVAVERLGDGWGS
ncbi:MAG TPA: SulP family inorganic anion transporter [Trueperaceae bacterium]|nr:SulP family inorganic anion transporter [Trueperaceae bacterium]